jgi:hypothetical protein
MAIYSEEPVSGDHGVRVTNDICERLDATRFRVDGRELHVPMRIADCSIVANVFWVDAEAVQRLVGTAALRVAEPLPGRTLLVLLGVLYRENPLGNYGEAAILFPVHTDGRKTMLPFGGLLSVLTGRALQLVYRMPVNQEFTAHAGRFLWGYPKYLADIDVALAEDSATVRLRQDAKLVFALAAPASHKGRLFETTSRTLTVRGGRFRSISGSVGGSGVSWRLGGQAPEIGTEDPLAIELRTLGLPKTPFLAGSVRHARMSFDGACDIQGGFAELARES